MSDMNIDLERVISDPAYRRSVLEYLKSEEADGKAGLRAAAATGGAGTPEEQSAPPKQS